MIPQHYRTTPPPRDATQAELVAWAVEEGRHWPLTPMFYYTWWLRRLTKPKKRARLVQRELF